KCYLGQNTAGCRGGSLTLYDWQAALQAARDANANAYKGRRDWRLPNVKELQSLADKHLPGPGGQVAEASINPQAFPGTPPSGFWSSTTYAPSPAYAWYVYFYSGYTSAIGKSYAYY